MFSRSLRSKLNSILKLEIYSISEIIKPTKHILTIKHLQIYIIFKNILVVTKEFKNSKKVE